MNQINVEFWQKYAWNSQNVRKDGTQEKPQVELPNFASDLLLQTRAALLIESRNYHSELQGIGADY